MGIEILQEEDDVFVHDEDVWIGKKTHVEDLFQKEQNSITFFDKFDGRSEVDGLGRIKFRTLDSSVFFSRSSFSNRFFEKRKPFDS